MNNSGAGRYLKVCILVSPLLIISCAKKDPTFSDLWDSTFSSCGVSCHSPGASDGTENGPDLTTKSNFYNNLVNKSVAKNYPNWNNSNNRTANCDSVDFITPGNASRSTLAASLILSISDSLKASDNCDTSYNVHQALKVSISDSTASDLEKWINAGAKNN